MNPGDDWRPTANLATLQNRARLLAESRKFFDRRGFFEVQTPVLSSESIVDRYIDPIKTTLILGGSPRQFFLQTSPELAMKRLVAADAPAIYQIGPVFRAGEAGQLHNPEFTMLEWYRVGDSYEQGIQLLAEFTTAILASSEPEVITYREAFNRHAGIDPFSNDESKLVELTETALDHAGSLTRDDRLNWVMSKWIEPKLGWERPTIVRDWPANQAALAQISPTNPLVAERYELFVRGLELANGYHELTNANELRRRMGHADKVRVAAGDDPVALPQRLVAAMQSGLPECCGVAVGFDRLVMSALGKDDVADVIPFPIDRA